MFYKLIAENELTYGPFVTSAEYELNQDFHTEYELPIDGWYWFDTLEEANAFFGITSEE
jgi:hypothetical protein